MAAKKKTITVEQIASANRRPAIQTKTLARPRSRQAAPHAHAGGYSGRPRHDQQVSPTWCASSTRRRRRKPKGATGRCGSTRSRTSTAPRRSACASAAASAPASARRAAAAARARPRVAGVAIGGFEGGQMPLHRRLPKRGFNKWRRKDFNEINVGALQQAIDDKRLDAGKPVDLDALVAAGIVRRRRTACASSATARSRPSFRSPSIMPPARPRRRSRRPAARSS